MAAEYLDSYLKRIDVAGVDAPDRVGLQRLHGAHCNAIPFENLDILLGRGIQIDLDRITQKLVVDRRGGYCFEQNTLFLAMLTELGFEAIPMEARVRVGSAAILPRTHMTLRVRVDGQWWLADVGFGGEGPSEPVPMTGTATEPRAGLSYRVVPEGELYVLQMRHEGEWADQYAFATTPVYPVDFVMANWFTSTHPRSPFVRTLTVQRATTEVRHVLRYPTYTVIAGHGTQTREIARGELMPMLRDVFGIDLPDDTVFPAIDGTATPARL